MSSYLKQLRGLPDSRALVKEILKRLADLENKASTTAKGAESADFRHYLRSNNDRNIYASSTFTAELNSVVEDLNLKNYQMPIEPDGDKLSLWLKFQQFHAAVATTISSTPTSLVLDDSSGFNHEIVPASGAEGSSLVQMPGPVHGLPALFFEGAEDDRLLVANSANINTTGFTTGFSISFNLRPNSFSLHYGIPRVIAYKTDDDPLVRDRGWALWIEPGGNLYFAVIVAGEIHTASKTTAFPSLNTWYRVVASFDMASLTPRLYVNGSLSSELVSDYMGAVTLPEFSSLNLSIAGSDIPGKGKLAGSLSDFRFWKQKVLSQTEIDNLQRNNYSISNIDHVARAGIGGFPNAPGEWEVEPEVPPPTTAAVSFTNISFTELSFTVDLNYTPEQHLAKVQSVENLRVSEARNYVKNYVAPPAAGKFFMATIRTEWYQADQIESGLYTGYLQSTDWIRIKVPPGTTSLKSQFHDLASTLPHAKKGMLFTSISDIQSNMSDLTSRGYQFIDYALDPNDTPSSELSSWQTSVTTARSLAESHGMEFHVTPSRRADVNYGLRKGTNVEWYAQHASSLHMEFDSSQDDQTTFESRVSEYAGRAKAANAEIKVTVQLTTGSNEPSLQLFEDRWNYSKAHYCDALTIQRNNDQFSEDLIQSFLQWFNSQGR